MNGEEYSNIMSYQQPFPYHMQPYPMIDPNQPGGMYHPQPYYIPHHPYPFMPNQQPLEGAEGENTTQVQENHQLGASYSGPVPQFGNFPSHILPSNSMNPFIPS